MAKEPADAKAERSEPAENVQNRQQVEGPNLRCVCSRGKKRNWKWGQSLILNGPGALKTSHQCPRATRKAVSESEAGRTGSDLHFCEIPLGGRPVNRQEEGEREEVPGREAVPVVREETMMPTQATQGVKERDSSCEPARCTHSPPTVLRRIVSDNPYLSQAISHRGPLSRGYVLMYQVTK